MTSTTITPEWLSWPETRALMRALEKHSSQCCFVGGAVRDALIGREVQDVDLATSLKPEQVMGVLKAAGIVVIPTGLKHGTITAKIGHKHFEITTLRRDTECDGRHASVEYTDDWKEDATRRDFTMNALYMTFGGEVMDHIGGMQDAQNGYVRFIGDAGARIREDYLRILRFFRFFAHYGKPPADAAALHACAEHAQGIESLSGERIQHEMFKLLASSKPYSVLHLMEKASVLPVVFDGITPHILPIEKLEAAELMLHEQADVETRLALMLDVSAIPAICVRWRLSNASREMLEIIHTHLPVMDEIAGDIRAQKKLLRTIGITPFRQLVLAYAAYACHPQRHAVPSGDTSNKNMDSRISQAAIPGMTNLKEMLTLSEHWVAPEFPVDGDMLKAHGIKEGVAMGKALRALEQAWEESDYTLTSQDLLKQVK